MGTKRKHWFELDDSPWLFKFTRPGHGEHWAEVIAAALAARLGLPHAHYDLAHFQGHAGVATRKFAPEGWDLVHGNELLAEKIPNYPSEGRRYIRTAQHTVEAVFAVVSQPEVALPTGWTAPTGITTAAAVFGGYLLLDALIGNTDRHHENWAVVANVATGDRYLAPTFDHATSLGSHELDGVRSERLTTRDTGYGVPAYVSRARSALHLNAGDKRALGLLEALREWASRCNCGPWLAQLQGITGAEIKTLIDRIPEDQMSGPARAFAQAILQVNKERILNAR